ncbi:MAG: hypothetical protein WD825_08510 [Gemmatimonadaceae bacterium]
MQPKRLLVLASLALAAGCGSDKITGGTLSGSLSFTYTGGGGGTFNVSGAMPALTANIGNSNWAAGHLDTPNTQTGVFGVRARGGGRYDQAVIGINRLTVGSSQVQSDCDPETDNCSGMVLIVDVSQSDQEFDFICILETGSLAITEVSSSRVKGTFSGTGECISSSLAISSFTATNGTFDVPLVPALPE